MWKYPQSSTELEGHPDNLTVEMIDAVLAGHKPKAKPATPWSDPEGAEKYFKSLQDDLKSGKSPPD